MTGIREHIAALHSPCSAGIPHRQISPADYATRRVPVLPVLKHLVTLEPGTRLTGPELAELGLQLKAAYDAGASVRALADRVGRSYGFVHGALAAVDTAMRQAGGQHPASTARNTPGQTTSVARAMLMARHVVGGDGWFRTRGWAPNAAISGCRRNLRYLGSFGSVPRRERRLFIAGDVVRALSAELTAGRSRITVQITTCGVVAGCPAHRSRSLPLGVASDNPGFAEALERWEKHAANLDCAGMVECLLLGDCSRRDPPRFPGGHLKQGMLRQTARNCIAHLVRDTGEPMTIVADRVGMSTARARTLLREHRRQRDGTSDPPRRPRRPDPATRCSRRNIATPPHQQRDGIAEKRH